ncbi:MAG: TPM domain-containing protein [bacterium]|nr:TPM domain-containing protein [Candidatus Jorgensenbacteria bacterium]
MRRVTLLFLIVVAIIPFVASAYTSPGKPAGFVNDFAGMLKPDEKTALEQKLSAFEKSTSNEISVVTIPSLEGDYIENYAVKLFEEWKIGKQGKDNGVLLLISRDDKSLRIEVGYGLEGALTDSQSYWIIQNEITPQFKQNNYYAGIDAGVSKIIAATQGEYIPSESPKKNKTSTAIFDFWYFVPLIFIWLASILGKSKSWWAGGVVGGVAGAIIGLIKGFMYFGIISIGILIPLGLIFDYFVSKSYDKFKNGGGIPPWWLGGGGAGGFGGGSGGGFGGFGGGRSGGGGSSGNW